MLEPMLTVSRARKHTGEDFDDAYDEEIDPLE
jgi:hypothetical protein